MAGIKTSSYNYNDPNPWDKPIFETNDRLITGQLITVNHFFDDYKIINSDEAFKAEIKRNLAYSLSEKILESNMVVYSQQRRSETNFVDIFARVFITPNGDTQVLRQIMLK